MTMKTTLLFVILSVLISEALCGDESSADSVFNPCMYGKTGLYPHPDQCQLYFDCGAPDEMPYFAKFANECPYPKQFDSVTKSCKSYKDVDCGSRQEVVNGCDYVKNQNTCWRSAHCRPCLTVDYPICDGLPDGQNPIPEMINSPFYAVCDSDRFVSREKCPSDGRGKTMLFHPRARRCMKQEDFASVVAV